MSTSVKILSELLSLYTAANASAAAGPAKELIVLLISDPDCYVFDDVLSLEPIKALKSQKIYQVGGVGPYWFVCFFFLLFVCIFDFKHYSLQ